MTDGWEGISEFLTPGEEVIVINDARDVARALALLTPQRARQIGEGARRRVLREHTYNQRAQIVDRVLSELIAAKDKQAVA